MYRPRLQTECVEPGLQCQQTREPPITCRCSILATRENVWAVSVCTEDGSELHILGPKVVHGEVSVQACPHRRSTCEYSTAVMLFFPNREFMNDRVTRAVGHVWGRSVVPFPPMNTIAAKTVCRSPRDKTPYFHCSHLPRLPTSGCTWWQLTTES